MKKTIFVGLSGGVDSSVAALRLKEAGHDVVGVFIKVWHPDFLPCNWEAERLDAMRVAAHLSIPFLTCDAEHVYRDSVAQYFIDGYAKGETPNPDVMCNKYVKFGAFWDFARGHGADAIATGHYAQNLDGADGYELHRGVDTEKDQSYFLWSVRRDLLPHIYLPIGASTKDSVRAEAKDAGIPTATKKDSQGICFLGHVDIADFLSHYVTLIPGKVLNEAGEVVGTHRGAMVYTIGQRHGFTIDNHSDSRRPHYVVAKNLAENTITVTEVQPRVTASTLTLTSVNWLTDINTLAKIEGTELYIQTRYRQAPVRARLLAHDDSTASIEVLEETEAPTVGQSCVLYAHTQCLGGGTLCVVR